MADISVRLAGLLPGAGDLAVTGVSLDSRRVRPGELYAALPGQHTHGARFARDAAARGAVAVLTDAEGRALAGDLLPVIVVDDPRVALAEVAAAVHGRPATAMRMFGITGTNGKTSTMFLLEAALDALGERVGTLGTIGFRVAGRQLARSRSTITTPEAPDLQALLAELRDARCSSVAMEVSSHALALHRVAGITFDVAGFTQFGRDHLEFHHTLQNYFEAKSRLFLDGRARACVVNTDDEWGRRLAGLIRAQGTPLLTTGGDADADVRLVGFSTDAEQRSLVTAATPAGELRFALGILGDFNVRNALTALAMVHAAGLDVARAATGLADAFVPGRMQRVRHHQVDDRRVGDPGAHRRRRSPGRRGGDEVVSVDVLAGQRDEHRARRGEPGIDHHVGPGDSLRAGIGGPDQACHLPNTSFTHRRCSPRGHPATPGGQPRHRRTD